MHLFKSYIYILSFGTTNNFFAFLAAGFQRHQHES